MVAAILTLLVAHVDSSRVFDLGNGLSATVTYSSPKMMRELPVGYRLELKRGEKLVAALNTRDLVAPWIKDDAYWGGHKAGNEARYWDQTTQEHLRGSVMEVVPTFGGCLIRMSFLGGHDGELVPEDYILRWSERQPDRWPTWKRIVGARDDLGTIRMPVYNGFQFLIGYDSIYKIFGDDLRLVKVCTLPDGVGWAGISQDGSKLQMSLINRTRINAFTYAEFDMATGKIGPTRYEEPVFGASGHVVPPGDPEAELPRIAGSSRKVPGMPDPLAYRHEASNWEKWVQIAADSQGNTRSRNVAFVELMDVVMPWGHGPWTLGAIRAAHEAIRTGPEVLRLGAIRTVRAWIFNYPQQVLNWTPVERQALQNTLSDPKFQQEVFEGAKRFGMDPPEHGPILSKPGSIEPRDNYFIELAPYETALAVSQSPLAFEYFKAKGTWGLSFMGYLHDARVVPYLQSQLDPLLEPNARFTDTEKNDKVAILAASIKGLARAGEKHFEPIVKAFADKRTDPNVRGAIVEFFFGYADPRMVAAISNVLSDESESEDVRVDIMTYLVNLPEDKGKALLQDLAKTTRSDRLRRFAVEQLTQWSVNRKRAIEDLAHFSGIGPPGDRR